MVSVSGFWFVSNRKKDINLEATNPIKSTYSMSNSIVPHICSKWPIFTLIFEFSGRGQVLNHIFLSFSCNKGSTDEYRLVQEQVVKSYPRTRPDQDWKFWAIRDQLGPGPENFQRSRTQLDLIITNKRSVCQTCWSDNYKINQSQVATRNSFHLCGDNFRFCVKNPYLR